MQHEVRAALANQRINDLFILARAKRGNDHGLSFTTGEQGRSVGTGQEASLGHNLAHRLCVAPVNALSGLQNRSAYNIGFLGLDQAANQHLVIILAKLFLHSSADLAKRRLAFGLVSQLVGGSKLIIKTVNDSFDLARF